MDKLIFLGTGHALTTHCYTTCLALTDGNHTFMTDGGGGNTVLLQMERVGLTSSDITDLFVSHSHSDHLIGVIWLVRVVGHSLDRAERQTPLTLYGEKSVLETLRTCCELLISGRVCAHFDKDIIFKPVTSGETCTVGPWRVTFFDTGAQKTVQYGWRAELANGKSCVFLGDEPLEQAGMLYAKGADYLIHEAMCTESEREKYQPQRIHHSTVKDAAENAKKVGASHLILFHAEDVDLSTRKMRYTAEAQRYFDGTIEAPDDLESIYLA